MTSYLSDRILPNNLFNYKRLVGLYTSKNHQLREGITPFLFVHAKNNQQKEACEFLSSLDWYDEIFESYIWDVNEDVIADSDVLTVQRLLMKDDPTFVATRLVFWGRWNSEKYRMINIRLLLNHLASLDDKALSIFFEKVWPQTVVNYYGRKIEKSERWHMINSLLGLIDDSEISRHKDFHNLFELLLYMCACSDNYAQDVYVRYLKKFGNIKQLDEVQSVTQSHCLEEVINNLRILL